MSEAERVAAAAPVVNQSTMPPNRADTGVVGTSTPEHGGVVFSIFGWPSRLRLDGHAVRHVLAEARHGGDFNTERLIAAAEVDAADRASPDDLDQDRGAT